MYSVERYVTVISTSDKGIRYSSIYDLSHALDTALEDAIFNVISLVNT